MSQLQIESLWLKSLNTILHLNIRIFTLYLKLLGRSIWTFIMHTSTTAGPLSTHLPLRQSLMLHSFYHV